MKKYTDNKRPQDSIVDEAWAAVTQHTRPTQHQKNRPQPRLPKLDRYRPVDILKAIPSDEITTYRPIAPQYISSDVHTPFNYFRMTLPEHGIQPFYNMDPETMLVQDWGDNRNVFCLETKCNNVKLPRYVNAPEGVRVFPELTHLKLNITRKQDEWLPRPMIDYHMDVTKMLLSDHIPFHKYFSHKPIFEVFPKQDPSRVDASGKKVLKPETEEALKHYYNHTYGVSKYVCDFRDHTQEIKRNAKDAAKRRLTLKCRLLGTDKYGREYQDLPLSKPKTYDHCRPDLMNGIGLVETSLPWPQETSKPTDPDAILKVNNLCTMYSDQLNTWATSPLRHILMSYVCDYSEHALQEMHNFIQLLLEFDCSHGAKRLNVTLSQYPMRKMLRTINLPIPTEQRCAILKEIVACSKPDTYRNPEATVEWQKQAEAEARSPRCKWPSWPPGSSTIIDHRTNIMRGSNDRVGRVDDADKQTEESRQKIRPKPPPEEAYMKKCLRCCDRLPRMRSTQSDWITDMFVDVPGNRIVPERCLNAPCPHTGPSCMRTVRPPCGSTLSRARGQNNPIRMPQPKIYGEYDYDVNRDSLCDGNENNHNSRGVAHKASHNGTRSYKPKDVVQTILQHSRKRFRNILKNGINNCMPNYPSFLGHVKPIDHTETSRLYLQRAVEDIFIGTAQNANSNNNGYGIFLPRPPSPEQNKKWATRSPFCKYAVGTCSPFNPRNTSNLQDPFAVNAVAQLLCTCKHKIYKCERCLSYEYVRQRQTQERQVVDNPTNLPPHWATARTAGLMMSHPPCDAIHDLPYAYQDMTYKEWRDPGPHRHLVHPDSARTRPIPNFVTRSWFESKPSNLSEPVICPENHPEFHNRLPPGSRSLTRIEPLSEDTELEKYTKIDQRGHKMYIPPVPLGTTLWPNEYFQTRIGPGLRFGTAARRRLNYTHHEKIMDLRENHNTRLRHLFHGIHGQNKARQGGIFLPI